jgi:Putative Flp pilus-assembly TadE/G-like
MERFSSQLPRRCVRFTRKCRRSGKITLVAGCAVLSMAVLAGFIGNAGNAVVRKMEAQNAADAAAFSSALWMARGMNGVTATNHLLGEATALATIHEALGGPELDFGIREYTAESRGIDAVIRVFENTAAIKGPPYYVPPVVSSIDKTLVDRITGLVSPKDQEKAKSEAFAAIYDAKMTLKRELAMLLPVKTFANIGFAVPPPWGYLTAIAAYGVHVYSSAQIVLIGKEWLILTGMEKVAKAMKPLKKVIEGQLIPTLSAHGDFLAGRKFGASQPPKEGETSIVGRAAERAIIDLQDRTGMDLAIFPAPRALRLPIEPEPAPSMQAGKDLKEWGKDNPPGASQPPVNQIALWQDMAKQQRRLQERIDELERELDGLNQLEKRVDEQLKNDKLSASEKQALEEEKAAIAESRRGKQERLAKAEAELAKLNRELSQFRETMKQLENLPKTSSNLSIQHLPKQYLNQAEERYSQWTRAAYPYVDGFRAPVIGMMRDRFFGLEKSKAEAHYVKWSNRYTLVKAWQFRSGYRLSKNGEKSLRWQKSTKEMEKPLRMYVMQGTFRPGKRLAEKGKEPWTRRSPADKLRAEKMFTLVGYAHREYETLFSPKVYPTGNDRGITTFAQAILYNGNEQKPPTGNPGATQANVGWDTLNWAPPVAAPEWGSQPRVAEKKWPWEIFSAARNVPGMRVSLNWQAKLMPVTRTRLAESRTKVPISMLRNVEFSVRYFEDLGHH